MGVETGFIIAGVVAAGLAIGQATGVIDLDPDKAPAKSEQAQPAKQAPAAAPQASVPPAPEPQKAGSEKAEPQSAAPEPAVSQPAAPEPVPPAPAAEASPSPDVQPPSPPQSAPGAEPAAQAPQAEPEPAPAKAEAAPAQPACASEVNLKGGFVVDKHLDSAGACVKTGRIRPLMAIECTDGSPAGWFHRYYLDDKRSPVFVTACMPPGGPR